MWPASCPDCPEIRREHKNDLQAYDDLHQIKIWKVDTMYEEFERKRKEWIEWLLGKDRHSINNQIARILWDTAIFNTIYEARRLAPKADDGGVQLNGMIHRFIDRNFLVSQAAAIRRLVDRKGTEGKRGVHSLFGLLDDMISNATLLRRDHMLRAEKHDEFGNEHLELAIDKMADVEPAKRSPTDTIQPRIFEYLKTELTAKCEPIKQYVHKFIAHAATPQSRLTINADDIDIFRKTLSDAQERILKTATFLGICVLCERDICSLAAILSYEFRYADHPLVQTADIPQLGRAWQDYEQKTKKWLDWGLDDLLAEMR